MNFPIKSRFAIIRTVLWLLLAFSFALTSFHKVALTVVADQIIKEFGLAAFSLGNLTAAYFYMYLVMQLPAGFIVDRGKPRVVGAVSTFLLGVGALVFANGSSFPVVFIGRLLVGLGGSMILINVLKFLALWYEGNKIGTMCGATIMVGNIGALLASNPLAKVAEFSGWRWPFIIVGLTGLVLSVVIWTMVRNTPNEMRNFRVSVAGSPGHENKSLGFKKSLLIAVTNLSIWPVIFITMGIYGSYMTLAGAWGVPLLMQIYGLNRSAAAMYMLCGVLGMIIGSPLIGYISDRVLSRKKPLQVSFFIYCLSWLLIINIPEGRISPSFLYLTFFAFGFSSAGITLMLPYAKEVSHPSLTGLAAAMVNMGLCLGVAICQPLFGFVLESYWEGTIVEGVKTYPPWAFKAALGMCAGIAMVSTLLVFLMHQTFNKNIYYRLIKNSKSIFYLG